MGVCCRPELPQHLDSVQTGSGNMLRDALVGWYVSKELKRTATAQECAQEANLCWSLITKMVKEAEGVLMSMQHGEMKGAFGQQQTLSVRASHPIQQANNGPP